jgi:hypothetical protein
LPLQLTVPKLCVDTLRMKAMSCSLSTKYQSLQACITFPSKHYTLPAL